MRANNRAKNERNPKSCSKVIAWTRICGRRRRLRQRRRRRTNRYKNIKSPPVYRDDLKTLSLNWQPICLRLNMLTYWAWDKLAANLQITSFGVYFLLQKLPSGLTYLLGAPLVPFFPSRALRCSSNASNRLDGAWNNKQIPDLITKHFCNINPWLSIL